MAAAKEMYHQNFKGGEDVNGFRWWMLALMTLSGAVAGSLIGYGLDQLGTQRGWYGSFGSGFSRFSRRDDY